MKQRRRRRVGLYSLVAILLASAAWLYLQRVRQIDLASRIPASAIGYLELSDWPTFVDQLTSTSGWQDLAPAYGLWEKFPYLGNAGWLIRTTGLGPRDAVLFSRSQLAFVVTSLEVRGEEVKPRLAFVLESHSSEGHLREVIGKWLPQLAEKAFGKAEQERSEYQRIPVTIFRSVEGDRRMISAQVGGEWVLANHPEAMAACLDARLERTPTLASNFYLKNARAAILNRPGLFGFVSGEGTTRLANFATNLVGARLFGESPLTDALRSVVTSLSGQVSNGLAYGMTFEEGRAVDRYTWLFKPQIVEQLRNAIKVPDKGLQAPAITPAAIQEMTIIRLEDPSQTFVAIEAIISSRLGAAESFVFHRFVLGAREALFGLRQNETASGAIGEELASIGFGPSSDERLWLVVARDRSKLEALTRHFLSQGGATVNSESKNGFDLLISSDERRGVAAFVRGFLVLGSGKTLIRFLEAQNGGPAFADSPGYLGAKKPVPGTPLIGFASIRVATAAFMESLARNLPRGGERNLDRAGLDRLPLSTSSLSFSDQSLVFESHSMFGSLPFIVSLFESDSEVGGGKQ